MPETTPILEDTTLRDGEQAPGVAFDVATKLAIHDQLVEAGVRWIEVGIPAMGGSELKAIEQLLERGSPATLVAWNRGRQEDVDLSLSIGYRAIHIGLPASDLHLKTGVKKGRAWLLSTAASLVDRARAAGATFVSVSAEDFGRADLSFVAEYARVLKDAGANRMRISDTVGILTPEEYVRRINYIKDECDIPLHCHAHNDYGLGVANTLAAVSAGASYFHVTVNGVGERAGMADLAIVATALKYLHGIDVGIDLTKLQQLSRLVARACGVPVVPWHPIVGSNAFSHESGIHAKAVLTDATTFEPMRPEDVGNVRMLVVGKHSGRAGVAHRLEELGVDTADVDLDVVLAEVREVAISQGSALNDQQLLDLVPGARPAGAETQQV